MTGYFVLYVIAAIWVFIDAKKRLVNGIPWSICTVIFGPLVVPIYLAKRPLKSGEVREGGVAWNVLKNFALFWTITMLVAGVAGMIGVSKVAETAHSDAEKAGVGIGMAIGFGLLVASWFFPMVGALVLGMFLKKSTVVEKGPTGPLTGQQQISTTSTGVEYHYTDANGNPAGPVPLAQLHTLKTQGVITENTWTFKAGEADWKPYSTLIASPDKGPKGIPQPAEQKQSTALWKQWWFILIVVVAIGAASKIGLFPSSTPTSNKKSNTATSSNSSKQVVSFNGGHFTNIKGTSRYNTITFAPNHTWLATVVSGGIEQGQWRLEGKHINTSSGDTFYINADGSLDGGGGTFK